MFARKLAGRLLVVQLACRLAAVHFQDELLTALCDRPSKGLQLWRSLGLILHHKNLRVGNASLSCSRALTEGHRSSNKRHSSHT